MSAEQRATEQCDIERVTLDDLPNLDEAALRYVADRAGSMSVKLMRYPILCRSWDNLMFAAFDELRRRGLEP